MNAWTCKSLIIAIVAFILISNPASAIKLENFPFMSDVHLGIVSGLGWGLNIGAGGWLNYKNIKFGGEIEQMMTDYDYTATINWTRYGGIIGYNFSNFVLNWHMGALSFTPSRNINYKDLAGNAQTVTENINYKGSYWAISADFKTGEFTLSPKYMVMSFLNKGSYAEVDLNLGKSF